MRRSPLWKSVFVGCFVAVAPFACTGEGGVEGTRADDERVTITRESGVASAGAVLLGRVAPSKRAAPPAGRVLVLVNGAPHVVPIAPDGSFQVRGLPTGEVTVKAELGGVPGAVVIDEVTDGELVEVSLAPGSGHLAMELTRRAQPSVGGERRGPGAELRGRDVVYHLDPGVREGDLRVVGAGVTLLGAHEGEACDDAHRTIVAGDLVVEGDDVTLYDVAVRGSIVARGKRVRVFDTCSGAYFDDKDAAAR